MGCGGLRCGSLAFVPWRPEMTALAGIDWRAAFGAISGFAAANAMAVALAPIAGSSPAVISRGSYYEIAFTPEQEDRVAAWIVSQLKREPGPVRVEAAGVALKVVTRAYWPQITGLVIAGATLGYILRGGK